MASVISLPAPSDGLPVGVQVVRRFGREREAVEVALALEARFRDLVNGSEWI